MSRRSRRWSVVAAFVALVVVVAVVLVMARGLGRLVMGLVLVGLVLVGVTVLALIVVVVGLGLGRLGRFGLVRRLGLGFGRRIGVGLLGLGFLRVLIRLDLGLIGGRFDGIGPLKVELRIEDDLRRGCVIAR